MRGPATWQDMLKNALSGTVNWQTRTWSNFTEIQVLEELESERELCEVCSQVVFKCMYLPRIGRPDILWSVNKLARSVTKWTQTCDRRLATFISNIHHTNDFQKYCHVRNTTQHCRLGLFQDSDFFWGP